MLQLIKKAGEVWLVNIQKKTIFTAFLAIALFLLVSFVQIPILQRLMPQEFFALHLLLEFFSIMVAISIAFQGWLLYSLTMSRHRLLIGALFFVVGVLDFFHTMCYKGMPDFLGESSIEKATWFWIVSRLIGSVFILFILSTKDKEMSVNRRRQVYGISLLFIVLISVLIGSKAEQLPLLVQEGSGPTALKNGLEYTASLFNMAGIILFGLQYHRGRNPAMLRLAIASLYLMLGGFIFTMYQSIYDGYNALGHIYKFLGYYSLMKGIFFATIEEPFRRHQEARLALSKSEKQLKTITNTLGEGVIVIDRSGRITFVNPEAERLLIWKKKEIIGKQMDGVVLCKPPDPSHDDEECPIARVLRTGEKCQVEDALFFQKDGSTIPVAYITSPIVEEDRVIGAVTAFRDITEGKRNKETIEKLAFYDYVTDLPNRLLLQKQLAIAIQEATFQQQLGAVLFVDLDRFKIINDSLGHTIGDKLLKNAAERIRKCLGKEHSVARFGGDEFVVILKDLDNVDTAASIASSIIKELYQPFYIKGHELFTTASVGVSFFPADGMDPSMLIKNADVAMYSAKKLGGNRYQLYEEEMNRLTPERLALENALHHALERNELELYYQPQIETASGKIVGMEALIRWNHPEKGIVSPGVFIPLAEETGLIIPIGEWVLKTACMQNKKWQENGAPAVRVAVNLSAAQFFQNEIVVKVKEVLGSSGLSAEWLELEITETIAMYSVERVTEIFRQFHDLGVQVSMDDFGTGYSSLSYLKHFPIKRLKIDQSFIRGIPHRADDAAIATSIIVMAHSLGLKVLGEGVETEEQRRFLAERGCDEIQGYLFSKPLPAFEAEKLLKAQTISEGS
ncbi:EAL domain-containing protein [Brevibacillus ruminantium]|uniref:EAL domain-containing protein n=1 Tax=Brevibacillus ruminantium TaxID=2950604 RepID=A0ABY4WAB0_9BACL|nr:EAL domain-containing protein [Brevibacillus ruminantium]USG63781.1 EAL domain-containing protein [Brevibacillus ruminantium]